MLTVGLIATSAYLQGAAVPASTAVRASAPQMFTNTKQSDPRVNFKATSTSSTFKKGKAPTAVKGTKRTVSSKSTAQTYIDVTGNAYTEVNTFVPQFDEIGVLPPLGRWDPLQIREQGPERYRRFVEMEIKHGRLAMAAVAGVLTTYSGIRFPGYLSTSQNIKFSDIPGGAIASWEALPAAAWFQIVLFITFCEIQFLKQDPNKAPGDVVPEGVAWARYPDGYDVWLGDGSIKQVGEDELILGKTWKLNAERNNGRAAMMGITGMLIHESLTGNPVCPIGETL
jgi:light-harvesting complex I chlorophyll a/b binding protein 1